jgi:ABC-2 type transport system permease protein
LNKRRYSAIKLQRLKAIARKEFLHVLRDWRSLALAIAIPVILILLFGYALNMDLKNVPTVIWDQSHTPESRDLIAFFNGTPYFSIHDYVDNYRDLGHALESGDAMVAITIPSDFSEKVLAAESVSIQVMADGSDANVARLALGYTTGLGMLYNRKIAVERVNRLGLPESLISPPVEMRPRAWYNADLKSQNVIVPGIIAIVMVVIATMLTSTTVAKEWELGTMEQLISTPIRGPEFILGKIIPYFVIGFVDVVIAVVMGEYVFHVPLRGSTGLIFGMAAIFLTGALFFGIMLSIILKKMVLANQVALLGSFLPTMLLSGFAFAIENMPEWIQYITYIVPARYFIALLRGIYLKGIGLEIMWLNALLLTIYALVMIAVSHKQLKLKLD